MGWLHAPGRPPRRGRHPSRMADTDTAITRPVPSARHADTAPPVRRELSSRPSDRASVSAPPEPVHEFPGCRPVHISRDAIADHEGRIEFWDADTETAMVCEPTTIYHEHPLATPGADDGAHRGHTRGADRHVGHRGPAAARRTRRAAAHPAGGSDGVPCTWIATSPHGSAMVVGEDVLPDVVLEVDHTTDARRGKLALYESWGLREVWVDVPEAAAQSRPANPSAGVDDLRPGTGRLQHGVRESRAFPGWRAAEIHRAMHEPTFSAETIAVLERIGRTLRDREGRDSGDGPFSAPPARRDSRARSRGGTRARSRGGDASRPALTNGRACAVRRRCGSTPVRRNDWRL